MDGTLIDRLCRPLGYMGQPLVSSRRTPFLLPLIIVQRGCFFDGLMGWVCPEQFAHRIRLVASGVISIGAVIQLQNMCRRRGPSDRYPS